MKLQDGETILHEVEPDPRIVNFWTFRKCIPQSFMGAFLAFSIAMLSEVFLYPTGNVLNMFHLIIIPLMGAILSFSGSLSYYSALHGSYRYRVTNMRCVFTGGILLRVDRSVPFHKITDIEISQTLLERIFGISTIHVFTPATAGALHQAEISFPGLVEPEDIAQTLNRLVRQSA